MHMSHIPPRDSCRRKTELSLFPQPRMDGPQTRATGAVTHYILEQVYIIILGFDLCQKNPNEK